MVAEKWPKRLFTKNTGLCEPAMGSIWTDTCPVLEGNGGRNYNGPKVAKFLVG